MGKLHENGKIQIYYRKKGNYIRSVLFTPEYPEKILETAESLSLSSIFFLYLPENPSWIDGELALLASSMGIPGYIVTNLSEDKVRKLLKGLTIQNYPIIRDIEEYEGKEKDKGIIYVDRAFVVKGVGVVITGFSYTKVNIHDKFKTIPGNKIIEIKSIQVLDEDQQSVDSGVRIGFALRNAKEEEMKDVKILSTDKIPITKEFEAKVTLYPWSEVHENGKYHLIFNGISIMSELVIEGDKVKVKTPYEIPLADRMIILNVNAKQGKPRVAGFLENPKLI
nr:translation elongation factor [Acidianus sp. RZ1]